MPSDTSRPPGDVVALHAPATGARRRRCPVCQDSGVPRTNGAHLGGLLSHCHSCGTSCTWPMWLQVGHAAIAASFVLAFWWANG